MTEQPTIEQVLKAREALAADEAITEVEGPAWMIDVLVCGHSVSIPIDIPNAQAHMTNSEEPLQDCCVEALKSKWLKEAADVVSDQVKSTFDFSE